MKAWLAIGLFAATALGAAQENATIGDFTKSPSEHIINEIDQPFVVESVVGTVSRKQGDRGSLPGVLFEIQGPGTDRKIRRAKSDEKGRFKIGHVSVGTYKFKATLNGFQSVMGTITVSRKADGNAEIKIEMSVGV
jgi:hypothetical protein